MLASAQPDLLAAISLLGRVREYEIANDMWKALTAQSIRVDTSTGACIARHRLYQNLAQYPLLHIAVTATHVTPDLLSALAATTTLLSVSDIRPTDTSDGLALQLKSVPSVRAFHLGQVSADVSSELLLTRKHWSHILLVPEHTAEARAHAALNQTDFELCIRECEAPETLTPFLINPHLTALDLEIGSFTTGCFDGLLQCQSLTRLVSHHSLAEGGLDWC
jgi:hypothetical protein